MKHRSLFQALFFEKDGDLNTAQFFTLVMGAIGSGGFAWVIVLAPILGIPVSVPVQLAAWAFLAGAFASVLIGSLPLAKAKVLARATLPGELACGENIGDVEETTES